MQKYWKIILAFIVVLYWSSPQIVYASFGGGHGGGGHSGGGSSSTPTGSGGGHSRYSYIITVVSIFIAIRAIKWLNHLGNRKLAKEIQFNQCYRSDLTALFIRFQRAWSNGNLQPIEGEMTDFLYEKNLKILKGYGEKGIEARTTDVTVQGLYPVSKLGNLLTVEFVVKARDYFVSHDNHQVVNELGAKLRWQRKPAKVSFTESWVIDISEPGHYVVRSVERK